MKYKKALLPIMISAVLSGGLSGCSKDKNAEEYLNNAQVLLQEGKNSEAIISLKNLLKKDLENAEGRFLLGKSYVNQGNWLAAEKELSRAKKYNYDPQLVYPLLADAYSHLEDSSGIILLLKNIDDDNILEQSLRYFLGVSYLSEGEEFRALSEFNDVVDFDADSAYGQLGQAWIYGLSKQFDEAVVIADKLIDSDSYSAISLDLKAKTFFAAKKMERAADSFKAYLKLRPLDHKSRLMYAMALAEFYDFEEAEVQANYILELNDNHILANQIKAQAKFVEKDFTGAKTYAEIALRGNGSSIIPRIVAGISAYQLGELEVAYAHLVAVQDKLSYQHPAQRLLTAIRFQLGYDDDNYKDLSSAPIVDLDTQLLSVSAQEFFKAGKVEESEQLLQRANQLDPENANTLYQLGIVKLFRNDSSAADFFKSALEKNPELDVASISLINALIRDKKYGKALQAANEFKKINPIVAQGLIGSIYLYKGDMDRAKKAFTDVVELDHNHIGGLFNLAKIAQYEGHSADAVEYYKKILKIKARHFPSISSLIQLSMNKEVQPAIEEYFKNNLINNPNKPIARLVLAEYYLAHKQLAEAKKVAKDGLKAMPGNTYLLMLIAKVETYMGDYDNSLKHLEEALGDKKDSVESAVIYASKSRIQLLKGDLFAAINEQKMAVKVSPSDNAYKLDLANLYLRNNRLKDAAELVAIVEHSLGENIGVIELKGRIAFLEHKFPRAITLLSKVHTQRPSDQVLLELVTAMQNVGKQKEALALINDLNIKELPLKIQLKKAELYTDKEPDKAILIYEELSKKTHEHYAFQNNLAWLYLAKKEYKKALKSAEVAITSAPNKTTVQDTYGVMLLASGQNAQALDVLKKVIESEESQVSYTVHYAEALIANGYKDEAGNLLNKINKQELKGDVLERFLSAKAKM